MRYYRLWIYSCNGVLLLSVLVFSVVGGFILADVRMRFVPLPLYHPTLLYGYVALILQAGVLQAVGCVSAVRLNERWLNVYWLLMLVLLIGDVLVGVAWVFLFSTLTAGLPSHLRVRLSTDYANAQGPTEAQALWDRLQQEHVCCGARGPVDYNGTQWFVDAEVNDTRWNNGSISSVEVTDQELIKNKQWPPRPPWSVPASCCDASGRGCYARGCVEPIRQWLQRSADLLFILGYCVIAFLKLCFLGILRYEIREMIQKIRLLQGELQALPDLAAFGMPNSPTRVAADKNANGNNNELEMKELSNQR